MPKADNSTVFPFTLHMMLFLIHLLVSRNVELLRLLSHLSRLTWPSNIPTFSSFKVSLTWARFPLNICLRNWYQLDQLKIGLKHLKLEDDRELERTEGMHVATSSFSSTPSRRCQFEYSRGPYFTNPPVANGPYLSKDHGTTGGNATIPSVWMIG